MVVAAGNVYDPGFASRTPVEGLIVKLAPTLIPPRSAAVAIGNIYAVGIDGLLRICANPVVAFQSALTGAVLVIVTLLEGPSQETVVPPEPPNSTVDALVSVPVKERIAWLLVLLDPLIEY